MKNLSELKLNFNWVEQKRQYASGERLKLNRIRVASYSWNISRPKGSNTKLDWHGSIDLPSLAEKEIFTETLEDMRAKIEKVVTAWFREALRND